MSKRYYDQCQVERTKVRTFYSWNLATGEKTFKKQDTVIEPCGSPLFGERDSLTGICASCLRGWQADGNTPTELGLQQIANGKVE